METSISTYIVLVHQRHFGNLILLRSLYILDVHLVKNDYLPPSKGPEHTSDFLEPEAATYGSTNWLVCSGSNFIFQTDLNKKIGIRMLKVEVI